MRLFTDGFLDPDALGDERTAAVLLSAAERATERLRPGDILHAALDARDPAVLPAFEGALAEGAAPHHLLETVAVYAPPGNGYAFDGARDHVSPELAAAFEEFESRCARDAVAAEVRLELLLACLLDAPSADERDFLTPLLDLPLAAEALRRQVGVHADEPPELYDDASGRLRSEEFTNDAWAVLELAAQRAAELGYDRLLPPHCLMALLSETEGPAERLFRLQLPLQVGLVKAVEIITQAFRITERGARPPRASTATGSASPCGTCCTRRARRPHAGTRSRSTPRTCSRPSWTARRSVSPPCWPPSRCASTSSGCARACATYSARPVRRRPARCPSGCPRSCRPPRTSPGSRGRGPSARPPTWTATSSHCAGPCTVRRTTTY